MLRIAMIYMKYVILELADSLDTLLTKVEVH